MKVKTIIVILLIILILGLSFFFFVSYKKDKAKQIILEDVNVLEKDIEIISKKTDLDDFKLVYEIEFYYQDVKYEYEVDLLTNKIIGYDQEEKITNKNTVKTLTQEDVKNIALKDAKIQSENVDNIIVQEDKTDGNLKYKIEFSFNKIHYEYKIDSNGKIIKVVKEPVDEEDTD